jgi:hypothetical protein
MCSSNLRAIIKILPFPQSLAAMNVVQSINKDDVHDDHFTLGGLA